MKEIVRELLNQKSFYQVLKDYELDKYELLSEMSGEMYAYDSTVTSTEKEILENIYKREASMFNLTDEKVMFISDTHMASEREELTYFKEVLHFCKDNNIQYLIHAGDIADGTVLVQIGEEQIKKNIAFSEIKQNTVDAQVKSILDNYLITPEVVQFVLGGNHDERYLERDIDILKLLAKQKNIVPLGYLQAFFTIYGYPISLEHGSRNIYPLSVVPNLFPQSVKIKGHSHIWLLENNKIYLPTLSKDIKYEKSASGLPGFIVMNSSKTGNILTLKFERFYYIEDNLYLDQKPYVLQRKIN